MLCSSKKKPHLCSPLLYLLSLDPFWHFFTTLFMASSLPYRTHSGCISPLNVVIQAVVLLIGPCGRRLIMRPPPLLHPLLTLTSYSIGLQSTPKIHARFGGPIVCLSWPSNLELASLKQCLPMAYLPLLNSLSFPIASSPHHG